MPRRSTWTGDFKAVGKTLEQGEKLYHDIKILENIGVWAVEVEVIPENIIAILSPQTSLIKSSLGSGVGYIQFLFAEDILGNTKRPYPRHSKRYADLYELKQKLQQTRINDFKNYVKDEKDNKFPYKNVTVNANDDAVNALEKYKKMKNRI